MNSFIKPIAAQKALGRVKWILTFCIYFIRHLRLLYRNFFSSSLCFPYLMCPHINWNYTDDWIERKYQEKLPTAEDKLTWQRQNACEESRNDRTKTKYGKVGVWTRQTNAIEKFYFSRFFFLSLIRIDNIFVFRLNLEKERNQPMPLTRTKTMWNEWERRRQH